jgi:hypothetical protein
MNLKLNSKFHFITYIKVNYNLISNLVMQEQKMLSYNNFREDKLLACMNL